VGFKNKICIFIVKTFKLDNFFVFWFIWKTILTLINVKFAMCTIEPMKMKEELHPSLQEEIAFFNGFIFSNLRNVIRIYTLFYFSLKFPLILFIFLFKNWNSSLKACILVNKLVFYSLKLVFLFKSLYSSVQSVYSSSKHFFL